MKTILSLLLLPILLLAQPNGPYEKEYFDVDFLVDFTMESIPDQENGFLELADGAIELFVMVEIYVWEMAMDDFKTQFDQDPLIWNYLPKYLNTFSLVGLTPTTNEDQRPQERLNRLLALNDSMFPKENTLLDRLHPVQYSLPSFVGTENMSDGFGPRIKL